VVDLLREGDRSVTDLASEFAVSIAAISQHLRVLREVGLVKVRQAGRRRFYRLRPADLKAVHEKASPWAERGSRRICCEFNRRSDFAGCSR
jgi:DNA-binding transcriptional ArsR family regulator